MKFRIGFKHVLKSPCKSSYSFFDTYYDDAFEAYQDTYECGLPFDEFCLGELYDHIDE